MAWTVDQATLGTNASTASASSIALTTTNTVASGGWIFCVVGHFNASASLSSVASSPALTWNTILGNNSGVRAALAYANAPSGFASGSTITATYSATTNERKIGAASFVGGDGTLQNSTTNSGTGTAWSVTPTLSGSALVVAAVSLDTDSGSTQDANSTELLDFAAGTASRSYLYYRIGGSPVGGTFGASAAWIATGASFADTAAAATIPTLVMAPPIPA